MGREIRCTNVWPIGKFPRTGHIDYVHCSSLNVRDNGRSIRCLDCKHRWIPIARVNPEWVLLKGGVI